jgi:hypothetical protein
MTSLILFGRRWYERSSGQWLHGVSVYIDGMVEYCSERPHYGGGDRWIDTAKEWLIRSGHFPGCGERTPLFRYCQAHAIVLFLSVVDVTTKKQL